MQKIIPRDYQVAAEKSVYTYFAKNKTGNPIIALPTGTGKSIVIASLVMHIMKTWGSQRLLMMTHDKKLISQNAEKLQRIWPAAPIGIYSAGLKKKEANMPVTFAGIQSAVKHPESFGHIDLIFIDEAHKVSPRGEASYLKFINALKEINPKLRVVGLTATKYRSGVGCLTEGGLFTDICFDATTMEAFNWFIDQGYIIPLIPRRTDSELDISGVKKRGGEFIEKQLQDAVNKEEVTLAALLEVIEHAPGRQRILVFATGIEHTEAIMEALLEMGESATCVHSGLGTKECDRRQQAHYNGEYRWLINNNMLTTGYDDPYIDCIVMLRPTASTVLWVQMLGRGTRPVYVIGYDLSTIEGRLASILASDKQNCLVFDFARNTARLGPVNDPVLPKKAGKKTGEIPIKVCEYEKLVAGEGCNSYNHISARFCCQCQEEFSFEVKITEEASTKDLVKKPEMPIVEKFEVDKVIYAVHKKKGTPDSLRVTYHCDRFRFREFIPAWHTSNIRHKYKSWWKKRTAIPLPENADIANTFVDQLKVPKTINVWVNSDYKEIMDYEF